MLHAFEDLHVERIVGFCLQVMSELIDERLQLSDGLFASALRNYYDSFEELELFAGVSVRKGEIILLDCLVFHRLTELSQSLPIRPVVKIL